jgi:hypothetical protein
LLKPIQILSVGFLDNFLHTGVKLVEGMLRRLAEVKEREGASTKYQSCPQ